MVWVEPPWRQIGTNCTTGVVTRMAKFYRIIILTCHAIAIELIIHKLTAEHSLSLACSERYLKRKKSTSLFTQLWTKTTRRDRPLWKQTLHKLAPPLKKVIYIYNLKKNQACDKWSETPDTWHMTCDTWWGVIMLSKFQLPSSYGLGVMMFWRFGGKGLLN